MEARERSCGRELAVTPFPHAVSHGSRGISRCTFAWCQALQTCDLSKGDVPLAPVLSLGALAGTSLQLHALKPDSFGEEKWKPAKIYLESYGMER